MWGKYIGSSQRRIYCIAARDDIGSGEGLPGFVEYSYKHILPTCFIAPLKCTFDFNDGHSFMVREALLVCNCNAEQRTN